MFLGHFAAGLAGRTLTPRVNLGTWFLSVQLVDLLWPFFLLAGLEHVRIAPGVTKFTPLDFYDYPFTHSLVAAGAWGLLFAVVRKGLLGEGRVALLLGAGVVSHWILDAVSHRPDLPVLPRGPYVGLGLWNSIGATLVVELSMFAAGVVLYARTVRPRRSFWILMAMLLIVYFGAVFGPPPPDVRTLAFSALAVWIFVAWAWRADRTSNVER